MISETIAWLALAGTGLTALGAIIGALVRARPGTITALGDRIDDMWDRIDEQDTTISNLKRQVEADTHVRHRLKNALVYVVSIANAAIAHIIERFTDEQIDQLPEPLRTHVKDRIAGRHPFDDHLDLTRPRTRHTD